MKTLFILSLAALIAMASTRGQVTTNTYFASNIVLRSQLMKFTNHVGGSNIVAWVGGRADFPAPFKTSSNTINGWFTQETNPVTLNIDTAYNASIIINGLTAYGYTDSGHDQYQFYNPAFGSNDLVYKSFRVSIYFPTNILWTGTNPVPMRVIGAHTNLNF